MSDFISTSNGKVKLVDIPLYHGRKKINRDVCKSNLIAFKKILDREGLDFYLCFGTLLGAVRENNFIEHDEDVDVVIKDQDREGFLSLLTALVSEGFMVVRYDNDLISVIRDNDYIDVYFFKKSVSGSFICNGMSIPGRYLKYGESICFLGIDFKVPDHYVELLVYLYGEGWKTPVKNRHANPLSLNSRFRQLLKKFLPGFVVDELRRR